MEDPLTPLSRSYSSCHGLHPHAANTAAHPGTWVGDAAAVLIRLFLPPRRLRGQILSLPKEAAGLVTRPTVLVVVAVGRGFQAKFPAENLGD